MDRKLLKTVQTITTSRNRLADPVGTRRGPPLVRGPQFENRCIIVMLIIPIYSIVTSYSNDIYSIAFYIKFSTVFGTFS